ncbi:MAG: hypothetical protein F4150_09125 [Chloroflexi bacterium]|nr:hypothetical protein [Chloroflexota bacterium]
MAETREKFSSQASPELLAALRAAARQEGRHFQAVLEDAMRGYLEEKARQAVRPEVMEHFRASVERHRLLGELLAR